ncbi:MAG: methionine--tRNA ligase [Candidatus Pacearchaeota archaeon]
MQEKLKKRGKKNQKKYYVTTAIDYVNAEPHIGHAYQKIIADVLARWHKLLGYNVWLLTGTDEHGKKIAFAAKAAGLSEKEFVDKLAAKFKESWDKLDINYSRFIRTTDKDHEAFVIEFVKKVNEKGDIYKGFYEGYYCTQCEAYYTEKDLIDGSCPIHKIKIEKLREESYFFRLSKYQNKLLVLYAKHPEFILPETRRNEIVNRVKEGLQDLSITRTGFSWGIPFPSSTKHVVYVWFDALLNYITGAGKQKEFWPADIHLLGKDNGWFHAVIWPAMLMSAGYKLPKTVFIHGFLTVNGQKISKSLGNVISPIYLVNTYGADSVRYFICRNFVFGEDGDFSEQKLIERHNNELADKLGNLVARIAGLAKNLEIKKTKIISEFKEVFNKKIKQIKEEMNNYKINHALASIFELVDFCNAYIQENQLWKQDKEKLSQNLYTIAEGIRIIVILLWPFIPATCEKIAKQYGFEIKSMSDCKFGIKESYKIETSEILFKKI